MMAALLDHLWQSSLFAAGIALLMPLFRRQPAALRFWLWFAASMKFLLPFAGLTWLAQHVLAPQAPAPLLAAIRPVTASLTRTAPLVAPAPAIFPAADLALIVWGAGIIVVTLICLSRWLELKAAVRDAAPVALALPVPVKAASSFLEPGLVGIWRPVILLPKGLAQQFEQAELDAVLAHELSHLKRRDNLKAALHMLVEGLFWFHPLVWWIGARLMEEREKACDEAVLGAGTRPRDYAEGILKTCRFYVQSPLACASGVSGALEARLGAIMAPQDTTALSGAKGLLLGGFGLSALLLPLAAGLIVPAPAALIVARVHAVLAPAPVFSVPVPLPRAALPIKKHKVMETQAQDAPLPVPEPRLVSAPAITTHLVLNLVAPALPAAEQEQVCRPPQPLPDSRLKGPEVCLTRAQWGELKARHQDVSADGHSLIATDYDAQSALRGHSCGQGLPFTASAGWNAGMPSCF